MKKKKILFYIKDPIGGTGRFLENISQILKKDGRFILKTVTHTDPRGLYLKANRIGFSIKKQSGFSFLKVACSITNCILFYFEFVKFKPDTVFSLDIYANITASLIKFFHPNIKLIQSTRVNLDKHLFIDRKNSFGKLLQIIIILTYRMADRHLVSTFGQKKQLSKNFCQDSKRICVIPNPVDIELVTKYSHEAVSHKLKRVLSDKKCVNLFIMSRFENQKKVDMGLYMFDYLAKVHKNLRLFILGDGALKDYYTKVAKNLGVERRIFFLGWQKNPYKFLRFADIYLFLSNYEGFPNALLEAQALGIFSIASDIDFGPREILNSDSGILIKKHSPYQLAYAVLQVINAKKYLISKDAVRRNAKRFDILKLSRDYVNLFIGN